MKWAAVKTPYNGSLWTGLALPSGALLACGMRGNVVRSTDDGLTWKHLPIADAGSLTGAARWPTAGRCWSVWTAPSSSAMRRARLSACAASTTVPRSPRRGPAGRRGSWRPAPPGHAKLEAPGKG